MSLVLAAVIYDDLNAKQKENYNYAKLSAVLADFGYVTMRLHDDWQGADFIAYKPEDERQFVKVQLKSRLTFNEKYRGKELYIAFREGQDWYLLPHDQVLERFLRETTIRDSESWTERGGYSFPYLTDDRKSMLATYRIPHTT